MTNIQRIHLQPAYVIFQRPFRDSSAIVEIFTESFGRSAVVARGIKRPGSKYRGLLQPFRLLLVSWVSKGELGTLTDVEIQGYSPAIKPKYFPSAFYLNELVQYLLHRDDPHEELFIYYHQTVEKLQQLSGEQDHDLLLQACLRRFELKLLQTIGYGLNTEVNADTHDPIEKNVDYYYVIDHGPVSLIDKPGLSQGCVVSGATLQLLADESLLWQAARDLCIENKMLFKEAKQLLRTTIDYHLGNRPLHSRDLFIDTASVQKTTSS